MSGILFRFQTCPLSPKMSVRLGRPWDGWRSVLFKKYNWHKRLIYLAQVPDLYILVVFAKLMIFQWPLYFLFLDNNDVKSFFKCSGNKNDPLSDSIFINFSIWTPTHFFLHLRTARIRWLLLGKLRFCGEPRFTAWNRNTR